MSDPAAQIKDSILHDVKQMIGQEWDDPSFDLDIIVHINSVFFELSQIGVGPSDGFEITDANTKWEEFTGGLKNLNGVKSYIYVKVRLLFDPPTNGFLVTSLKEQADKLEWRLMVECDPPLTPTLDPNLDV